MAIKGITLKESMNRSVQAIMPLDEEKEVFNQKLVSYLTHLKDKEDESEEYQKNLLKGFLESVLPYNDYFIHAENPDKTLYDINDIAEKERLTTKAKAHGLSLSAFFRLAADEYMNNHNW